MANCFALEISPLPIGYNNIKCIKTCSSSSVVKRDLIFKNAQAYKSAKTWTAVCSAYLPTMQFRYEQPEEARA